MKITNLETKQTKTGQNIGRSYLSFEYDGKKLNYFDEANFWVIQNAYKDGADININTVQNGKFWNIVGVEGAVMQEKKGVSRIERAVAQKNEAIETFVEKKNEAIKEHVEQKNESMKKFAAQRDAALFAASPKTREELTLDLEYWSTVFKEKYGVEYDPSEIKI